MKRTMILALVVLTSASFCLATTGGKDKKKKKNEVVQMSAPVNLVSKADSLSFAMGMEATNGLIPYLTEQLGMDTTYMSKFIEGFSDAIDSLKNNKEIVAYGAGINIAQTVNKNMIGQASKSVAGIIDEVDGDLFKKGFLAALRKDYAHFNDTTAATFVANKHEEFINAQRQKGEQYLADNKTKEGVVTLPSGLQYKVLREGNGSIATKNDEVEVKYEGRLIDGTIFDSSYERNPQTTKFRPTQVIKGWTEALTLMPEGSMWELYIPQNLAYGERQAGKIPPFSTLIFKVELVKVTGKE